MSGIWDTIGAATAGIGQALGNGAQAVARGIQGAASTLWDAGPAVPTSPWQGAGATFGAPWAATPFQAPAFYGLGAQNPWGPGGAQPGPAFGNPWLGLDQETRDALGAYKQQQTDDAAQAQQSSQNQLGQATANPSMGNLSGQQIDAYIQKSRPGSPLAGKGDFIAQTAAAYGVPVPVILGIMTQESQLGADGSYLPSRNNYTGLTGTGWQGQTGSTSGMAREFATFATPEDGIRAAIQNFAQGYKGLTLRQAVSKWLTGSPTGSGDEFGNNVADYLNTMQAVFQGLGVAFDPDAVPTLAGAGQAGNPIAGQTAGWQGRANALAGTPYTMSGIRQTGDPASGVDCSSYVGYVFGLPSNLWTAQAEYDNTARVGPDELQPGDLVFFAGTYNAGTTVTHVGIYVGGGKMMSAIDSGVGVQDLNSPYWQQHLYGYGRLGQAASGAGGNSR